MFLPRLHWKLHYMGPYFTGSQTSWQPPGLSSYWRKDTGSHLPENWQRPWTHIALDFPTDLPESERKTTILVVTDRFSRYLKLILLPALSTALETAEVIFSQVFRYFGLLEDIVSDRGPQFISLVWKGFKEKLGITVSISSGFHPQSNDQKERGNQEIGRYLWSYLLQQ